MLTEKILSTKYILGQDIELSNQSFEVTLGQNDKMNLTQDSTNLVSHLTFPHLDLYRCSENIHCQSTVYSP